MNKDLRTSSRGPSLIAAVTAFLLLTVGVSFCRSVKTESKWFGLASQLVDQGPDWFSITILVAVGTAAAYAIAKTFLSKPSVAGAGQTSTPTNHSTGVEGRRSTPTENGRDGLNLAKPGGFLLLLGSMIWRLGYKRGSPLHGSSFWVSVACLSVVLGIGLNFVAWRRRLIVRRSKTPCRRWITSLMVIGMGVLALITMILVILLAADTFSSRLAASS